MQLCFSTLACPNWTLPQIVGAAAAHGLGVDFRGVGNEIDITQISLFNEELDSTLELLASHEIEIPCYNTSIALVATAAERWEMMLEECGRYAALAAKTNAKWLRVFGGNAPKGMSYEESRSMARRHLRQLIKICSRFGCVPLVETHDQWSTGEKVLELLEEFSPEETGVLWDMEHTWRGGERPEETMKLLAGWTRHVHFKDAICRPDKYVPCLLGEGEFPLDLMLGALEQMGYEGWLCLETENRWHPTVAPEPEESLAQFVRYMGKHWKQPVR